MSGLLSSLFDAGVQGGDASSNELIKALSAGYGTDSATMTGGRSLIPEDIESTLVMALDATQEDFKFMNALKKQPVYSTVHEYTRLNEVGSGLSFVGEGEASVETDSEYERVVQPVKYLQTERRVTLQMTNAQTLVDAIGQEKINGTLLLLQAAETANFRGNASVNPAEYNGVLAQIYSATKKNVVDLRGKRMSSTDGENAINEIAQSVFENTRGGSGLTDAFMPSIIASDVQALARDRYRFSQDTSKGQPVVTTYPNVFGGDISIGQRSGPTKFFRPKGTIVANGDAAKRPGAPATVVLTAQTKTGGLGFLTADAGDYEYVVHSINQYGTSAGTPASAAVSVANGEEVEIAIAKPASGPLPTGYIITRSKKGVAGGHLEMVRVAYTGATQDVLDRNEDLPGTGEVVFISNSPLFNSIQFNQFLPLMKFDLYPGPGGGAIHPFLLLLWGSLDVKVPWYHGVIKNISYAGLDWFA
jgi:hypothetical protein